MNHDAIADKVLPGPLIAKCMLIVEKTHRTVSSRTLPRMIATKRNAVAAAMLPEGRILLDAATSAFRICLFLWGVAILALVLAPFLTWWLACLTGVAVLVERIVVAKERDFFIGLSATLLGAEILAIDFAGWGNAYPTAREKVMTAFGISVDTDSDVEWLDFYLPRRAELDADMLKAFGPDE